MDKKSYRFLRYVLKTFRIEASDKFVKGNSKHGGNLLKMSVLDLIQEAKQEHIDGYVYLCLAEKKLKELK